MRIKIYLGGIEILVNLVYLENLDVLGGSGGTGSAGSSGDTGIFWDFLGGDVEFTKLFWGREMLKGQKPRRDGFCWRVDNLF